MPGKKNGKTCLLVSVAFLSQPADCKHCIRHTQLGVERILHASTEKVVPPQSTERNQPKTTTTTTTTCPKDITKLLRTFCSTEFHTVFFRSLNLDAKQHRVATRYRKPSKLVLTILGNHGNAYPGYWPGTKTRITCSHLCLIKSSRIAMDTGKKSDTIATRTVSKSQMDNWMVNMSSGCSSPAGGRSAASVFPRIPRAKKGGNWKVHSRAFCGGLKVCG